MAESKDIIVDSKVQDGGNGEGKGKGEKVASTRKMYTMAEVEKHNTEQDAWMVVHNLVLHLPKEFLDEHPGGPDVVTCMAGKEATADFEDIGHSDSARTWASKHIIGYLEGTPEEEMEKSVPKNSEVSGKSGGGGLSAMLPAIIVVILAAVAYFVTQAK
ncbi:unnamed protein product [Polarella glacialis]|uniref:Cytochrome b5 heme-binding domain-containing protein n=1 Tax=Polarella glacialis TaxID=89957 RepID=A0A813ENS5_POLGL|nr:unnamed protein product [Polarella glacialis]CAE8692556.1 unnamed protein product [Polarella glacialis]